MAKSTLVIPPALTVTSCVTGLYPMRVTRTCCTPEPSPGRTKLPSLLERTLWDVPVMVMLTSAIGCWVVPSVTLPPMAPVESWAHSRAVHRRPVTSTGTTRRTTLIRLPPGRVKDCDSASARRFCARTPHLTMIHLKWDVSSTPGRPPPGRFVAIYEESGAEGARTPDLLGAIQALSQLSYSPARRARIITPPSLFSKQLRQGRKPRDLVAEHLQCGRDRNGKEYARDAPDEPPEHHADHDGDGIELEPPPVRVR